MPYCPDIFLRLGRRYSRTICPEHQCFPEVVPVYPDALL
jgi:hypothetical protein